MQKYFMINSIKGCWQVKESGRCTHPWLCYCGWHLSLLQTQWSVLLFMQTAGGLSIHLSWGAGWVKRPQHIWAVWKINVAKIRFWLVIWQLLTTEGGFFIRWVIMASFCTHGETHHNTVINCEIWWWVNEKANAFGH